jgi:hypothetical protein
MTKVQRNSRNKIPRLKKGSTEQLHTSKMQKFQPSNFKPTKNEISKRKNILKPGSQSHLNSKGHAGMKKTTIY